MNTSDNVTHDIVESALWVWVHLGSAIFLSSALYASFRVFGYADDFSLFASIIILITSILAPTLFLPAPSRAKERLYLAGKRIYPFILIIAAIIIILKVWNIGPGHSYSETSLASWSTSMLVGVAVLAITYLMLDLAFSKESKRLRHGMAAVAAVMGIIASVYTIENPSIAQAYVSEILIGSVGIIVALIAVLRKRLE